MEIHFIKTSCEGIMLTVTPSIRQNNTYP